MKIDPNDICTCGSAKARYAVMCQACWDKLTIAERESYHRLAKLIEDVFKSKVISGAR